jgi:acetylglutamate synthase
MEEIWKDIEGYEGYYQVSNLGRVKSLKRCYQLKVNTTKCVEERILSPRVNKLGYAQILLHKLSTRKTVLVHRLVASAFLKSNGLPYVNHKNGIKSDNRVENLEYVTASQNTQHSVDIGTSKIGEDHYKAKLTKEDVYKIKYTLTELSNSELGRKFGVTKEAISLIRRGINWKQI